MMTDAVLLLWRPGGVRLRHPVRVAHLPSRLGRSVLVDGVPWQVVGFEFAPRA